MNYSDLQTTISEWLNDERQVDLIPNFISLFEGMVRRELRVSQMEGRSTANTTGGKRNIALPIGHIKTRSLHLNLDPQRQLYFMPPQQLITQFGADPAIPQGYAIVGGEYLLGAPPSGEFEIESDHYSFVGLSSSNPTNWLLDDYPDAYLYGSLSYAEHERTESWAMRVSNILANIEAADRGDRWNGVPMTPRPDFVTP